MSDWFCHLQNALPQHLLSRTIGRAAASERPWLKDLFINQFQRAYDISLEEAEITEAEEFRSFNDFFTRSLTPEARPIADAGIVSPADGAVSQLGSIDAGRLLQAKGHQYRLTTLAGPLSEGFDGGRFITIYLAPSDYHRVHLPASGNLDQTWAAPGALFSVNGRTEQHISGLFCRNERLVCRFDTEFGPMLVILVGALIVASIATVWPGPESPYQREELTNHDLSFQRGAEIGRFLLGSTVICCFPAGAVHIDESLVPGVPIRMGEAIGNIVR